MYPSFRFADLLLDTFVYNAHTSAGDALWAGVPILTVAGEQMPSRVCAAMVTAAGFPELIFPDASAYERKAVRIFAS